MRSNRIIIFFFFLTLITAGCNNADKKAISTQDSVSNASDTGNIEKLAYETCYENFFTALPTFKDSASANLLLQNGKKVTMTQFFKDEFMSLVSQYGIKDLDGDGVNELIVYNNTGGAHCCDEYYIFRQNTQDEFKFSAHLMGGQTCIDKNTNIFAYSFSETLGYFFGCYACGFEDSSGRFKTMREIELKYQQGNLKVVQYDTVAEKQNIINLELLQQNGFEKIEGLMDNGWRKEYAMNLAVWHYNHEKDWQQTKTMFTKYYNFKDAAKVWNEFYNTLTDSGKQNTF